MIEQIERFGNTFQSEALRDRERSAQPQVHVEEIEAGSRVAANERPVDSRTGGGPLDRSGTGGDVERQCRVVLQHAAQLEAVAEALPRRAGLVHRRMNRAVENQAMSLVVVRTPVVLPDIEIVDRG